VTVGLPVADLLAPLASNWSVPGILAFLTSLVAQITALLPDSVAWRLVLIPPITGIIGYITNWVGIRLLFYPVDFWGVKVPGLSQLTQLFPTKLQQIPGVAEGKIGWQGIVPSRAAKMGSLAVDNGINRIATQREFYEAFDPQAVAEHVVAAGREDIHALVEDIVRREHPQLWRDAPEQVRQLLHQRVDDHAPEVAERVTDRMGDNIDELVDVKLMVVNHLEANPRLLNRMFLEIGETELKFLVNSGFVLGTLLGCVSIPLFVVIDQWWVLPMSGVFVGYATNYIAIKAIFSPTQPIEIGPYTIQGLFIKRQDEAAAAYAELVADEILTVERVAENMLHGSKSDRTRKMIRDSLRPAVDEAVGTVAPLVRVTTGDREYEAMRERLASESIDVAFEPLTDEAFNEERSQAIRQLITERMRELPPEDYVMTLRSAFQEDEWLLIGIGAVLGFVAGWLQLLMVTAV
jgi:uncharacterized membrane protein YheB (UPF0754 family)